MGFEKGNKLAGSRKGKKNRINNDVRQVFHEVYENMGEGIEIVDPDSGELRRQTGKEAMLSWAQTNQTEFYRLYAKMIPATAELPEEMHEDFIGSLVFEAEEGELTETTAVDVGNEGQLQLPSGETVPDTAPHVGDVPIDVTDKP
jgi:hypothetical protein